MVLERIMVNGKEVRTMRKLLGIFAVALVMLAAVSCDKNDNLLPDNQTVKGVTLSATINNTDTKTTLGTPENGIYPLYWSKGDKIAVMQGNNKFEFTLQGNGGSQSGLFECTSSNAADFDPFGEIRAFYPYSYVVEEESYLIPATLKYSDSAFPNGVSPMAAYRAEDAEGALKFENLFGVLKLQLKGNGKLSKIQVSSMNDIALSGYMDVTITSKNIGISANSTLKGSVSLDCGTGVSLSSADAREFLIALPAGEHALSVTFTTSDNSRYFKSTSKLQTIEAGTILKMPVVDLSSSEDVIKASENSYIQDGVYLGEGIEVTMDESGNTAIWAPYNCGYHSTNYPYGKLYQWGRKYGQGRDGRDKVLDLKTGKAAVLVQGTLPGYKDIPANGANFYYVNEEPFDWISAKDDHLWNNSTEKSPVKTVNDPCPDGWRVPTIAELKNLGKNMSSFILTGENVGGRWFCGNNEYGEGLKEKVFMPNAGFRNINGENGEGAYGYYWSSSANGTYSWSAYFTASQVIMPVDEHSVPRSAGLSVRCIKE